MADAIPALPDYGTYLNEANDLYNGDGSYASLVGAYKDSAKVQSDAAYQQQQSYLSRMPQVQQTYANLAAELKQSSGTSTAAAFQTGTQNIGAAKAGGAAAGIQGATGAFAAPITAAQNQMTSQIAGIADKYQLDQATLTDQMNSSINDLQDKANQAKSAGDAATADLNLKLIDLQQQHDSAIASLAKEMYTTDNANRQFELKYQQDELNNQLQLQKLNVMAQHYAATEESTAASQFNKDYAVKDDTSVTNAGGKIFTYRGIPISAAQYVSAAQGGGDVNLGDVVQALSTSQDPNDKLAAASYNAGMPLAELQKRFPQIFGGL